MLILQLHEATGERDLIHQEGKERSALMVELERAAAETEAVSERYGHMA